LPFFDPANRPQFFIPSVFWLFRLSEASIPDSAAVPDLADPFPAVDAEIPCS
jgi:hypothetical protein